MDYITKKFTEIISSYTVKMISRVSRYFSNSAHHWYMHDSILSLPIIYSWLN